MKFGKLEYSELDGVDFELPKDSPKNKALFDTLDKSGKPNVYVGCAKWGRKEWLGLVYPKGTKEKDFLAEYTKHFNGIELNATFYGIRRENVESWAEKAGDDFRFNPKFSQIISHRKRLNDAQEITDGFYYACEGFGSKMGHAFLQMPDNFGPNRFDVLENYIKNIPSDFPMCIELRHTDWFTDPIVHEETFDMLKQFGRSAVITDTAGRRDCVHQHLTSDTVFIRFNGYDLHPTDFARLDAWVPRLKKWIDGGLKNIYFYCHQEDETYTPQTCAYFIKQLNETCGLSLAMPGLISEASSPHN